MSTPQEILQAIERLNLKQQIQLLHDLPRYLKISPDDLAWSRLTEPVFEFWSNPEDAAYDKL